MFLSLDRGYNDTNFLGISHTMIWLQLLSFRYLLLLEQIGQTQIIASPLFAGSGFGFKRTPCIGQEQASQG
jgi:hypothetical protein